MFNGEHEAKPPPERPSRARLTPREIPILELVAEGLGTKQIARRLHVCHQTVTFHIKNLLKKLESENRTELVSRAFVRGYLQVGKWPPSATERDAGSIEEQAKREN